MAKRWKWKWEENAAELNEVERLKLKKDGLDVIQDIYRYAKLGYESIPEEDFTRLKWAGIYQQRPKDGHFMMRIRIPSGILNSRQVRVLAELSREYGRGGSMLRPASRSNTIGCALRTFRIFFAVWRRWVSILTRPAGIAPEISWAIP